MADVKTAPTAPTKVASPTGPATPSKSEQVKGKPAVVKVSQIRDAELALRQTVDRTNQEYIELRTSVERNGILNPPSVRPIANPENPNEPLYMLVDGLQRTTAARDCKMTEIPVYILEGVDAKRAFELQFVGNLQHVETRPADYAKALKKWLALDPLMTKTDLAVKLSKSLSWLEERLKLTELHADIAALVNDGTIKLANATALAALPVERQPEFKDAAISKSAVDFTDLVNAERSAIRKAQLAGRPQGEAVFVPRARYKQMNLIANEADNPVAVAALLTQNNIKTPADAAKMALKWAISLDPVSVSEGKAAFEAEQAKLKKEKEERAAERTKKKEEAAKKKLEDEAAEKAAAAAAQAAMLAK